MVATPDDGDSGLPMWYLLAGGAVVLLVLAYAGAYVTQAANLARYQEGFLLTTCPICARGTLYLEDRRYRVLGIPRVRLLRRLEAADLNALPEIPFGTSGSFNAA